MSAYRVLRNIYRLLSLTLLFSAGAAVVAAASLLHLFGVTNSNE